MRIPRDAYTVETKAIIDEKFYAAATAADDDASENLQIISFTPNYVAERFPNAQTTFSYKRTIQWINTIFEILRATWTAS